MWLMTIALTLGGLGVFALAAGRWRVPRHLDHGSMSQAWLAEHRAGNHPA
jgi:hypothetical protein